MSGVLHADMLLLENADAERYNLLERVVDLLENPPNAGLVAPPPKMLPPSPAPEKKTM